MKTIKLFTLLVALLCTTTSTWATDYNVGTDAELRAAIQNDGANITVTADIDLSNSTLSIATGTTVTIDLGGHTLDRKLTQRGENGGQVITVREDATLNLSNGTLKGGWGGDSGGINNEGGTVNLTNVTITGCTGDDKGGGICNRSGGTLTMNGGSITANTSNDHTAPEGGGGIFNAEDAMATLTNVSITGNEAKVKGGGGICNYGTLTIDGCTIQDNIAKMNGGGIWNGNDATLSINGGNISGNTADEHGGGIYTHSSFSMQGAVNITDNKRKDAVNNNVYLTPDAVITVTGSLENSSIGLTMENATGTFTSGYNTYNSGVNPATIFTPDLTGVMAVSPDDNNEAQLSNSLPDGDIYYIERSWDDVGKCVKAEIKKLREGDYIVLNGSDDDLIISQGTFVVKGDVSYDHIYTVDGGEHNIILCDGAKLSADFLRVEDDNEVYIYGQANNTGQLVITEEALAHHAGIGSDDSKTVGTIVIHGGDINTKASNSSAGIGGGRYSPGGTVIIYGGKVYAEGNESVTGTSTDSNTAGSGIGGGFAGNGGDLTVYGGNINAEGGSSGAGIGSGRRSGVEDKPNVYGGNVTVYGGTVIAHGSVNGGAGIGGGTDGNGATVTIHGGTVKAWGRGNGAGIGTGHNTGYNGVYIDFTGKLTVTGGEVYAYGHDDEVIGGAGIGGGKDANGSEVIITGGYVYAEGGRYSAGIGSGCEALFSGGVQGGSLTVTGGRVEAYGGEDAAGIGGGEDADGGTVTISGGYVYAKGSYGGAGIGGGEGGDGANVSITGGTVHASAGSGDTGNRAIGPGYGSDEYGSLTLGDLLMVWSERMAVAAERVPMCWYRTDVHVEPCTHQGANYTDNGSSVNVDCIYCSTGTTPYTFQADGNWNDGSKWLGSLMPHEGNDVAVKAQATIPSGCCAHVGAITIDGGSITIADGGQLIHNNAGVTATMQKNIIGHGGDNDGGWNFIASPMVTDITPAITNGFLTEDYDLYYYDEPAHYWRNFKPDGLYHGFDIEPQKGYLYASQANTTLGMTGTLQPSNDPVTINDLSHEASVLKGFNLVGNPFACNATIDRPFYVIEGKHVVAYEGNEPIAPATGVMVQADADHESVIFTKVTPEAQASQPNNGSLQIALAQANTRSNPKIDNAIVSFREGSRLEKFYFGNNAKLYIPQGGKDYAIAFSEGQGEMPLNFKATENGTYTITVNTEGVEMGYLHLIDNMTGADVDLLPLCKGSQGDSTPASYTFTAKTTDYESRFRLVFICGDANDDNEDAPFAFISNGEIVVNGEGILQVIDMMGRQLFSKESSSDLILPTSYLTPGIYVLRLINGENVKTQKIVIE